jgi:hypothetical protein
MEHFTLIGYFGAGIYQPVKKKFGEKTMKNTTSQKE